MSQPNYWGHTYTPPAVPVNSDVFSQLFGGSSEQVKIGDFPEGKYTFGVYGNGLFEREIVPYIGTFTTLKNQFTVPGIGDNSSSFVIGEDFPKIPGGVLNAMVKFYRSIMEDISSEVMTMIVYDTILKDYKILVPVQKVSGATVRYDAIEFAPNEIYIASFHSHVNMAAFFSSVDDADEKRAMFYGVIGKLKDAKPMISLRAKKDKTAFPLRIEDMFDMSIEEGYEVPDLEKLKISQVQYQTYAPHYQPGRTWVPPAGQPRKPVGQPRVYDYRREGGQNPGNQAMVVYGGSGYDADSLEHYYSMYADLIDREEDDWSRRSARRQHSRLHTSGYLSQDLDVIDAEVALALNEFVETYVTFVHQNMAMDLTPEEESEHYFNIAGTLLKMIDSLDVSNEFFDQFQDMYEAGGMIDDDEISDAEADEIALARLEAMEGDETSSFADDDIDDIPFVLTDGKLTAATDKHNAAD